MTPQQLAHLEGLAANYRLQPAQRSTWVLALHPYEAKMGRFWQIDAGWWQIDEQGHPNPQEFNSAATALRQLISNYEKGYGTRNPRKNNSSSAAALIRPKRRRNRQFPRLAAHQPQRPS